MTSATHHTTATDDSCPFLDLPGELRNMIYAYALYEPAGLRFRQDESGIGRLESMPLDKTRRATVSLAACKSQHTGMKEELIVAALRVANQLQYSCRQLRDESRGLGVRYNEISFEYLRDALAFIEFCPPSETKHLGVLKIRTGLYSTVGTPEDNMLGLPDARYSQLFKFCTANPWVEVRNPVIGWRQTNSMFVPYSILVQMQFRQSSSRIMQFFTDPNIQEQVRTVTSRKVGHMGEALPVNFRLFPDDDVFNEASLKDACMRDAMISKFFDRRAVDGGIERWVAEVRKIYEHGI